MSAHFQPKKLVKKMQNGDMTGYIYKNYSVAVVKNPYRHTVSICSHVDHTPLDQTELNELLVYFGIDISREILQSVQLRDGTGRLGSTFYYEQEVLK